MIGMVVLMINSSVLNKIHYNLFKPEGGPDPKLDILYAHKTGEFFERI